MFKIAIGHSEIPNEQDAVLDCIEQSKEEFNGMAPKGALIFAYAGYDYQKIIDVVKSQFPDIKITGCSSFGEITSKNGVCQNSIAIMFFISDEVEIKSGIAKDVADDEVAKSFNAAKAALENSSSNPSYCLVLGDGLTSNVSDVIKGFQDFFGGQGFAISGGTACDDWEFKKVYQFTENQVASNAASFMIFSKPLKTSTAVRHGRFPLPMSQRHVVTKSNKNTVYTIDNKPAFDFYRESLGEHAHYESYALLVYPDSGGKEADNYLVRSAFRINKEDGSITFPADVKENSIVGISQHSTQKKTLEAAALCAQEALKSYEGKNPAAALVFSCALRKEILGTAIEKELELIKSELPEGLPIFGFYTFGEIGPFNSGQNSSFYNETIVVTLIGT